MTLGIAMGFMFGIFVVAITFALWFRRKYPISYCPYKGCWGSLRLLSPDEMAAKLKELYGDKVEQELIDRTLHMQPVTDGTPVRCDRCGRDILFHFRR